MRATCCVVGFLLALTIGSGASASPLTRSQGLAAAAVPEAVVSVRHKAWHHDRGGHYGWYRGKHKGWYKHWR